MSGRKAAIIVFFMFMTMPFIQTYSFEALLKGGLSGFQNSRPYVVKASKLFGLKIDFQTYRLPFFERHQRGNESQQVFRKCSKICAIMVPKSQHTTEPVEVIGGINPVDLYGVGHL